MTRSFRWSIAMPVTVLLAWLGARANPHIPPAEQIPEFAVRVRVTLADGEPPAADAPFSLSLGAVKIPFHGPAWSDWAASTPEFIAAELAKYPNSYNRRWELRVTCSLRPAGRPGAPLMLEVETRLADGDPNRTPAELIGGALGLLLWRDAGGDVRIDTLAGHGRRVHDGPMRAAELPPGDRPRRIIFGERYIGGDSDALAWREGIERLCGLGFNAMHPVPEAYIPVVRQGGITQLWGAVYSPPGYAFNFAAERRQVFLDFASNQVAGALKAGWQREEIAFWVVSDEPGWYYPAQYQTFNQDPAALAAFHAYLRAQGLRPRDLGHTRWEDIRLIGRKQYQDLPSRRLFYWSNRFPPWASSRFFAEVTTAFEHVLGPQFPIMVNFNNFLGRLYQPGPVGNNRDRTDPNAAMGQHDWLEFGRLRGSTCIATEDWFADAAAPQWSFYATRMRSAAAFSGVGFGALVIPRTSGQRPEGMAQKLLALVGQGAKNIKFFTFGPEYNFPQNCYSYHLDVYQPLALGMGIVGRAEELLYPGVMRPSDVAILMPQSAQLWDLEEQTVATGLMDVTNTDPFRSHTAYLSETYGLHLALQHAAIPVQAIDEPACNRRDLAGYRVIYLTAPDLPREAADALIDWVRRGGTLVMTAGSGLHDRYHQPMDVLVKAAGIRPEQAVRPLLRNLGQVAGGPLVSDGAMTMRAYGERERLTVTGADVRATYEDGAPALTERRLRRGRILRFAGFPGLSYRRSATETRNGLPAGFCDRWRSLIIEPVRSAGARLPAQLDRRLIEAPVLYSEQGAAVTLLNWSGEPQTDVTLTVGVDRQPHRVVSARRGDLAFQADTADGRPFRFTVQCTLDLNDVDVISIYYQ